MRFALFKLGAEALEKAGSLAASGHLIPFVAKKALDPWDVGLGDVILCDGDARPS
jgi:hypothetical protein